MAGSLYTGLKIQWMPLRWSSPNSTGGCDNPREQVESQEGCRVGRVSKVEASAHLRLQWSSCSRCLWDGEARRGAGKIPTLEDGTWNKSDYVDFVPFSAPTNGARSGVSGDGRKREWLQSHWQLLGSPCQILEWGELQPTLPSKL